MTARKLAPLVIALVFVGITLPALTAAGPDAIPSVGQKAGRISALLPVASVIRDSGKTRASNQAKKGDELIWNDLVRTEKGGRARITLTDQSILSVGSQSELHIVKHDARSQHTTLQLTYGRLRAEVTSVTRDGRFEVRTPTAVAGVIGTDFGVISGPENSEFVCISGTVSISSADPTAAGNVLCAPGQTTSVAKGKPPSVPKPATAEQINNLIQQTEPAISVGFVPAAALQGTAVDATVTGARTDGIKTVAVSGSGVRIALNQGETASSASVHIVVDADAEPGPRTVTLAKASGPSTAAVFNILEKAKVGAAPSDADVKAPYRSIIQQEQAAAKASITAAADGVQQLADLAYQQIDHANGGLPEPLNLEPASTELSGHVTSVSSSVSEVPAQVDDAAAAALRELDTVFSALKSDLLERDPKGAPDELFMATLNKEFLRINDGFLQSIETGYFNSRGTVQNAGTEIARVLDEWLTAIKQALVGEGKEEEFVVANNGGLGGRAANEPYEGEYAVDGGNGEAAVEVVAPTARANRSDVNVGYGAPISLNASASTAAGGASIAAYQWTICGSSYRAGQACEPVNGLISTAAEFNVNGCALPAGNYTAHLVVTDTNDKTGLLDVPINVALDDYDGPAQRLINLAAAYSSLQLSQFMQYFDPLDYPAYATLQENMRTTLASLSSMQVQVLNAQPNVNCNDASLQTGWSQIYSFKSNPAVLLSTPTPKPLTITFKRNPGVGWFIRDFQGDDGTVQGAAAITPTDTVDIAVESVTVSATVAGGLTVGQQVVLTAGLKNYGATTSKPGGTLTVTGDSTLQLTGVTAAIPPIAPGATVTVEVPFTLPITASGSHSFTATITTRVSGDNNSTNESKTSGQLLLMAPVDLRLQNVRITSTSPAPPYLSGQTLSLAFDVANAGNVASGSTDAYTCSLIGIGSVVLNSGTLPILSPTAAGATPTFTTVPVSFTVPKNYAGTNAISCTISDPLEPLNLRSDNSAALTTFVIASNVDLQISNAAPTTLQMGANVVVSVDVINAGLDDAPAGWDIVVKINGAVVSAPVTGPAVPGNTATPVVVPVSVTVPQLGTPPATATLDTLINTNGAVTETTAGAANNLRTGSVTLTSAVSPYPNYTITDIRYSNSTTGASHQDASGNVTGDFAIVAGEWVDVVVTVANTDPNNSPVNDLTVTYNCGAPSCSTGGAGNTITMVVAAPPANSSVNVVLAMLNFSGPPGQYTATATVTAGVQESNPGDNTFTKPWDLFNWQFAFAAPSGGPTFPVSPELNIPAGGSGQIPISVTEVGVLAGDIRNVDLTVVMDPPTANASFSYPASMGPGVQSVSINPGNSASGTATVYVDSWAWKVAKEVQQSVRFYTATLQNITDPANSSSTPLSVTRGGTTVVRLQYNSDLPPFNVATFDTAASAPAGFTVSYTGLGISSGQQFEISVITQPTAPSLVTALPIRLKIPNTYPAQTVETTVYVLAAAADLSVTSPAPDPTIPRNFTTGPWAAGEAGYFVVNVANIGNAAALGPVVVTLSLNGTKVGSATAPGIAAGDNTDVAITAYAPDTALSGTGQLTASVTCASFDINPLNNVSTPFNIPVADWTLVITSPYGTPTSRLVLEPGVAAPVEIALQLVGNSGTRYPMITLESPNLSSSNVSVDLYGVPPLGGAMYGTTATIHATAGWGVPDGEYFFQVIGDLTNGRNLIRRQVTIHAIVGSGVPLDTVTIISDRNNAGPLNSTPTPVQINGLLAETLNLQATRSLCSPPPSSCGGMVDLLFSDGAAIVSNVTGADGSFIQDTPIIPGTPYNTPKGVMFAAETNDADEITTGPANVIISATEIRIGVASAVREYPRPDPVGTQQTLLAFNIGDIDIMVPACINVPPNAAVALPISWRAVNSFNASPLNWAWAALPSGISADISSGSSTLQDVVNTTLTNLNSSDVVGLQTASFQVSITNASGTATKTFSVGMNMAMGACVASPLRTGATANPRSVAVGTTRLRGSWKKGSGSSVAGSRTITPSGMPDLRISANDITYAPSVPKPGDRIDVRFRVSNVGDANAVKVPIALRVNGTVVASDTFDVAAGKSTLAGLQWTNAQPSAAPLFRRTRTGAGDTPLTVELVIDPAGTVRQKTTVAKAATLARFSLRAPVAADSGARDRIVVDVAEGACAGLRFSGGARSGCTGVDIEIAVEDVAAARYTFTAPTGIADLGYINAGPTAGRRTGARSRGEPMFAQKVNIVVGHSYAVQMRDSKIATITVQAIHSAQELQAKTAKVFDKGVSRRSRPHVGSLGGNTAPIETGDVAPSPRTDAKVTFELLYETP